MKKRKKKQNYRQNNRKDLNFNNNAEEKANANSLDEKKNNENSIPNNASININKASSDQVGQENKDPEQNNYKETHNVINDTDAQIELISQEKKQEEISAATETERLGNQSDKQDNSKKRLRKEPIAEKWMKEEEIIAKEEQFDELSVDESGIQELVQAELAEESGEPEQAGLAEEPEEPEHAGLAEEPGEPEHAGLAEEPGEPEHAELTDEIEELENIEKTEEAEEIRADGAIEESQKNETAEKQEGHEETDYHNNIGLSKDSSKSGHVEPEFTASEDEDNTEKPESAAVTDDLDSIEEFLLLNDIDSFLGLNEEPERNYRRRPIRSKKWYQRRRKVILMRTGIVAGVIILAVVPFLVFRNHSSQAYRNDLKGITAEKVANAASQVKNIKPRVDLSKQIEEADVMAAEYDYDSAIKYLKGIQDYEEDPAVLEAIDGYEESKKNLVEYKDVTEITHIFFHSLIVETDKAFDGDNRQDGYNQMMTTVDEFEKIMQQMYDRGYVLVSIKDIAQMQTDEDGNESFVPGTIMLPEGKKPFVLSIDDVSYYEYMEGDGFASRIVLDENGRPTCEMDQEDGTTKRGDFDVVPCLETFIESHPDFSYKGARGILALTGYNGVLGYRTDPSYADRPEYENEIEEAMKVAQGLKDWGWEFASHSYGHLDLGNVSFEKLQEDTQKWADTVAPIIGETDILIFPFGADIGNWEEYSGERFDYLKDMGFKYFCNVDSAQYWVQIREDYVRQGRRNLDGVRMYYDLIDDETDLLSDLFNVEEVFDKNRPTPVPEM